MYKVPYKKTSLFSNIVEDYIEDKVPKDFYNRLPCVENFNEQIKEKSKQIINQGSSFFKKEFKEVFNSNPEPIFESETNYQLAS